MHKKKQIRIREDLAPWVPKIYKLRVVRLILLLVSVRPKAGILVSFPLSAVILSEGCTERYLGSPIPQCCLIEAANRISPAAPRCFRSMTNSFHVGQSTRILFPRLGFLGTPSPAKEPRVFFIPSEFRRDAFPHGIAKLEFVRLFLLFAMPKLFMQTCATFYVHTSERYWRFARRCCECFLSNLTLGFLN